MSVPAGNDLGGIPEIPMSTNIPTPEDLATLRLPELRRRYEEVLGKPTKAVNKTWLARRVAAGLAAKAADEDLTAGVEQTASPIIDTIDTATVTTPADAPAEPEPAGPWGTARTIADRLPITRSVSTLADLDALLDTENLQARVCTELDAQRKALAPIEALTADDDNAIGTLKALLGNRRIHKRPGVLAAVQRRLAELDPDGDATPMKPLADMDTDELRTAYETEVGRTTGSDHRGYLIWKIREARKGNITVGEVARGKTRGESKTVPVRMGIELLEAVDAAWKREGFSSRVAFIREVLGERVGRVAE